MRSRIGPIGFTLTAALVLLLLPGAAQAQDCDRDNEHHHGWRRIVQREHENRFERDDDRDAFGAAPLFDRSGRRIILRSRVADRDDDDFDRDDLDDQGVDRIFFPGRNPRTVVVPVPVIVGPRGSFGPAGRPPGWDRGRKVGWGNCDVPPGLAKKEGCGNFLRFSSPRSFPRHPGRGNGFRHRHDR